MKANEIPTENIDEYLNHLKEAYEGKTDDIEVYDQYVGFIIFVHDF